MYSYRNGKSKDKSFIKFSLILLLLISLGIAGTFVWDYARIGKVIDSYKGVAVYHNGYSYTKDYGRHYGDDGYYYGLKWQCVEYGKRFYYDALNHEMPDGFGHAKDFFDLGLKSGSINTRRNLIQYSNGGVEAPKPDDLIVFTGGTYGHVAIVTEVAENYIEIIQQNVFLKPREKLKLETIDGKYYVGEDKKPAGWLRKVNK